MREIKTIHMGLNTEPDWINAEDAIRRWKAEGNNDMVAYWEKAKLHSLNLRDEIIKTVEAEGACELSWSCTGRTRHEMHAHQWAEAMTEYDFEIGYNYHCVVRKRA